MYAKSSISDDHLITDQQMTTLFDESAMQAEQDRRLAVIIYKKDYE